MGQLIWLYANKFQIGNHYIQLLHGVPILEMTGIFPQYEELKLFTMDDVVRNAVNKTLSVKGTKIKDETFIKTHWY